MKTYLKKLITEDYLYIDKTKFIEVLENRYNYVAFLRPRRFGKSLIISMLEHYYDEYHKNEFDEIFKGLYIDKNPTKFKSSYKILFLEFSGIQTKDSEPSWNNIY